LLYLKFIISRGSLFGYTTPNTNKHYIKFYMKTCSDSLFINNLYCNTKNAFCSNDYNLFISLLEFLTSVNLELIFLKNKETLSNIGLVI
jgi:hypothetical protein